MDVRLPDGTIIQNVPDGTSRADLTAKLKANGYQGNLDVTQPAQQPITQQPDQPQGFWGNVQQVEQATGGPSYFDPAFQHHIMNLPHGLAQFGERIAAGLALRLDPDAKSEVTQALVKNAMQTDEAMRQREAAYQAATPSTPGSYAGAAVGEVLPFMAGGAASKFVAPAGVASLPARMAAGAGAGSVAAMTAPSTTTGDIAQQTALRAAGGAVLGAAVPPVASALGTLAKGVYNVAEPFLTSGQNIRGREYLAAAGERTPQVLSALQQSQQIVPGALPTAGEAATPAGSAEFSALQKSASQIQPSQYVSRADLQNQARIAALQQVGKTPTDLAVAEAARANVAGFNYQRAYQNAVQANPQLSAIAKNPYVRDALPDAMKLAEAKGLDPFTNPTDRTEFLHLVKISLDKALTKTGDTALSNTEKAAVQAAKTNLVDWLAQANPAYDVARSRFAQMSVPINQMQIGQYLESKLTPPLNEFEQGAAGQRAAMFANALREAPTTIQRATGQPYEDLSQILTPEQLGTTESVAQDLARKARFENLAKAGAQAGPSAIDVASRTMERPVGGPVPNMLSRPVMIANALIRRLEGKANDKIAQQMATEMLDPQAVASTMQATMTQQAKQKALADLLRKSVGAGTLAGIQEGVQ